MSCFHTLACILYSNDRHIEDLALLYDMCCEYRRLFPDEIARDYQENQGEEE